MCAAAPEAATPRRRDGGAARPPGRHSRISGRLCLLGGAAARRKRGSASLGTVEGPRGPLYVQRLIFSAGAARKAYGLASLLNRWALQGNLRRVSHASSAQDDLWAHGTREASAAVPFWYFWGWALSRAALATGSATNRALRQRIATQHSVGHEETRMPCAYLCETRSPAPRASQSGRSRWSRWPAVVLPSRRRRNILGKRGPKPALAVVRH